MSNTKIKAFALGALVLAAPRAHTYQSQVYIPKTATLADGGAELLSRFSFFSSTERVDSEGEVYTFSEGEGFYMADLSFEGSYGLTRRLQATLGATARYAQSTTLYQEEEYALTSNGLKSGLIGLKYSFASQQGLQLALEANYEPSFFTNKVYDGGEPQELVLGDDGTSVSFGGSATYGSTSGNFLTGKVLYRNPSSTMSSEIYTEVEAAMVWEKFALLAGVENVTGLNQDAYSNDPQNKPLISSGSTFLFNSVNREWTAPYVGMNFAFGKNWRLEGRYQRRIAGNSTDLGNALTFVLARRNSETKTFQAKNQAFKEYTVEAVVTKVSKAGSAVVIDAGMAQGLKEGSRIDFYHFDYVDGNELIAAGKIVKLGATKSLVKIVKRYAKKRVEDGTLARGGLIKNNP